jgi:hypothetical protein
MGSLRRNAAGNIYFWMNTGAILADLCQLFPGGGIGTVQSYIGYQGLGIAIDLASDEIYLGTKSTSPQAGIHRRAPIGGALTPVSPGIASSSQTHLVLDTQGNLYVSNGGDVRRVTATGTTTVYTPGPSVQIQSLNVGVFDHLLAVEHTIVSPTVFSARVVSITPEGLVAPLVDLGPVPPSPPPVACLDLAGTGIYVLSQGALYHITGPFTLLSVGSSAPGFLKARLDTLGTAPFVLAADVPGISFSIPGWGTFNTSLGTGPGWILLFDSIGIFHLPDPISTPWSQTVTAPPPQGLTLSFQAYVVDVAAANGIIAISGPAILQF